MISLAHRRVHAEGYAAWGCIVRGGRHAKAN